jgi:DMSO/TMAO reductase YedYZ heme-binding membrane subunit
MSIQNSKRFNDWPLFYRITAVNSLAVIAYLPTRDLSGPLGVSEMIQYSVRCCVPFLYLAFAASSLNVLAPSAFSRWLLRNRRYVGLSFAAGMGWQLLFIIWMVVGHWGYFIEEVFWVPDLVFQVPGYLFIFAMSVTSFHPIRRKMGREKWRVLHRIGIYFLWYTVVATYYDEITYYDDRQVIDYVYAGAGLLALFTRIGAWAQLRVGRWRRRGRQTAGSLAE